MGALAQDFEKIIDLCEELEGRVIENTLRSRIANAYERAIEKALTIAWYEHEHTKVTDAILFRHAERGAREKL